MEAGIVKDWPQAIALADEQSATPPPREYVRQGLEGVEQLDDEVLARYGLDQAGIDRLRHDFADGAAAV